MRTQSLRVLMVDQSLQLATIARSHLDPSQFRLVGQGCAYGAMPEEVRRHLPDVVVVELTGRTDEAFAAIEAVMADHPTRILVLNTGTTPVPNAFRALALGALDVLVRPPEESPEFWQGLGEKLQLLAQVQVV